MKKSKELKMITPSVLSFERKIEVSDGVFFQCRSQDMQKVLSDPAAILSDLGKNLAPVGIQEKKLRSIISNRIGADKEAKDFEKEIENPNLQKIDAAALSPQNDILVVRFSGKVLGGLGKPNSCNNALFAEVLTGKAAELCSRKNLETLAERYICNLLNGRALWRNRVGADSYVSVLSMKIDGAVHHLTHHVGKGEGYELLDFDMKALNAETLMLFRDAFIKAWNGRVPQLFTVDIFTHVGFGAEVYPSQEMILREKDEKGGKSRVLYVTLDNIAGMHSQKIGNALRTIDTWYPDCQGTAISVEPYGTVSTESKAYRHFTEKKDFYTLFDGFTIGDAELTENEQLYVLAMIIRGGVFSKSEKESKKKVDKKATGSKDNGDDGEDSE